MLSAFLLAITEWPANKYGYLEEKLLPAHRQLFQALHVACCDFLGEPPHAPDMRPAGQRSAEERAKLSQDYRWSSKAIMSHVEAFEAWAG